MRTHAFFRPFFRYAQVFLLTAAMLAAGLVAPVTAADDSARMLDLLNAERSKRGAHRLVACADLEQVASRWSRAMAAAGKLSHNPAGKSQVTNWRALAENVGYASSTEGVHRAFMKSDAHRRNALSETYTEVGIGVYAHGGKTWVTQVFRKPARSRGCAEASASRSTRGSSAGQDIRHACSDAPRARFTDVSSTHRPAVDCLVWYRISSGLSSSRFGPARALTRAQAASLLARTLRAADVRLPEARSQGFRDVKGSVHATAIRQLTAMGIFRGRTSTRFSPQSPVTRAQIAALAVRVYEKTSGDRLRRGSSRFADVGRMHASAINTAAAHGLMNGHSSKRFAPAASVRRAHAASCVARLLDLLVRNGHLRPPG